ncbi:MAG: Ribose 5-phosphate isomerase [Candidatus Syntrophoarchaeum caldarius]|uniref:Ribose-5-phosphate isomerase A n=1 Tax=Candidatus Syntropharchaeum caldarium TaxID=1838285 RepID=A0A1F2P9Q3_9EURY|nr:MAG: Ribose 5-phosphate isomerase [Candidatus Syntrophoarchaeum caldarius]
MRTRERQEDVCMESFSIDENTVRYEKRIAAESAVRLVESGMDVGLGTGSTAELVIKRLGYLVKHEGLEIRAVATSKRSERLAHQLGIEIKTLDELPELDICIDGADQVDSKLNLIKGGGGAHTREKIVASSSNRFIVCVDERKIVPTLRRAVPIEVLSFAKAPVSARIRDLGGTPVLRMQEGTQFVTDNGNIIIDADFGAIKNPEELAVLLSQIPGVVEHGIFMRPTEVHVGERKGVRILS